MRGPEGPRSFVFVDGPDGVIDQMVQANMPRKTGDKFLDARTEAILRDLAARHLQRMGIPNIVNVTGTFGGFR